MSPSNVLFLPIAEVLSPSHEDCYEETGGPPKRQEAEAGRARIGDLSRRSPHEPEPDGKRMKARKDKADSSKRDLILDAAEHLFSQKGFATVTTREIASKAGVSLSALPYYFGSKQEILRQVLDRRLSEIQHERAQMLRAAKPLEPESPESMRLILEALLQPTFIMSQEHRDFTRLLGAVSIDPNPDVQSAMNDVFAQYPTGLPAALRECAAHLDDEDFFWRFYCIIGAMIYIQSDTGRMDETTKGRIDFSRPQDNLDRIVTFMLWGLAGPPSKKQDTRRACSRR